jgi:hypothetical protein
MRKRLSSEDSANLSVYLLCLREIRSQARSSYIDRLAVDLGSKTPKYDLPTLGSRIAPIYS